MKSLNIISEKNLVKLRETGNPALRDMTLSSRVTCLSKYFLTLDVSSSE